MNLRKLLAAAAAVAVLLPQTVLLSDADDELLYDRSQDLIGEISMTQKRPKASALQYSEIPVTAFRVSDLSPAADTDMDYTDWWYSEWDDCRYLFLPVTADPAQLVITYSAGDTLYLNGQAVVSGEAADLSGSDGCFQVTVGERLTYPDERIVRGTARELAEQTFDSLSVIFAVNPEARAAVRHGIPQLRTAGWINWTAAAT